MPISKACPASKGHTGPPHGEGGKVVVVKHTDMPMVLEGGSAPPHKIPISVSRMFFLILERGHAPLRKLVICPFLALSLHQLLILLKAHLSPSLFNITLRIKPPSPTYPHFTSVKEPGACARGAVAGVPGVGGGMRGVTASPAAPRGQFKLHGTCIVAPQLSTEWYINLCYIFVLF